MGGRAALRIGAPLAVALVQIGRHDLRGAGCRYRRLSAPDGRGFVFSLIAGLADGAALILLYRGLAIGRIGVVAPLTGVCSIAVPAIVELIFVTTFGPMIVAGIVLAAIAVMLIAHGADGGDAAKPIGASVVLGLASGVTFGITTCFSECSSLSMPMAAR